jgi:Protein of unknown function (DUF3634)
MNTDYLWRVFLLALAAAVIWQVIRPKYVLRVTIKQGRVTAHSGIPTAKTADVVSFLEHDVPFDGNMTILGSRDASGSLRLRFKGSVAIDVSQRIRNYLKMRI